MVLFLRELKAINLPSFFAIQPWIQSYLTRGKY